jgi:hypothetical protein
LGCRPLRSGTVILWLLGLSRKGKGQRNQWKDDPQPAGSVHSCKPLSDGALTPSTFALSRASLTRATLVTAARSLVSLQIRNRDNFAVIATDHPKNDSGMMGLERFRAKARPGMRGG